MRLIIFAAIGMLSLLWGSSFIPIKNIVDVVSPISSFGLRFLVAGVSLIIAHFFIRVIENYKNKKKNTYIFQNSVNIKKNKNIWKNWIVTGLFFIVGGQGLLAWGAQYLSSGATALINSTIPIWVAIFTLGLFKVLPAKLTIAGIAFGFIGLIILILPTIDEGESNIIGIVFLILSSISWALGSLYTKPDDEQTVKISRLLSTGMFMSIGGVVLITAGILTGASITFDMKMLFIPTSNLFISFLYLTMICTAIGYAIFYWLLDSTTPTLANTFAYIVPMIAVFLGWIILNESITLLTMIATGVISGGVALMVVGHSSASPSSNIKDEEPDDSSGRFG